MAIRVQHHYGGAAGIAAFAAGRGQAQERERKYNFALLEQQQRFAQRMAPSLRRYAAAAQSTDAVAGHWEDPLDKAADPAAAMKARDRRRRLGRARPGDEPTFMPDPTKEDIAAAATEEENTAKATETKRVDTDRYFSDRFSTLPPIPEDAGTDERKDLESIRRGLHELARSPKHDRTDDAVANSYDMEEERYRSIIASIPTKTLDERFAENTLTRDGVTYEYNKKTGNWEVLHDTKPEKVEPPPKPEEVEDTYRKRLAERVAQRKAYIESQKHRYMDSESDKLLKSEYDRVVGESFDRFPDPIRNPLPMETPTRNALGQTAGFAPQPEGTIIWQDKNQKGQRVRVAGEDGEEFEGELINPQAGKRGGKQVVRKDDGKSYWVNDDQILGEVESSGATGEAAAPANPVEAWAQYSRGGLPAAERAGLYSQLTPEQRSIADSLAPVKDEYREGAGQYPVVNSAEEYKNIKPGEQYIDARIGNVKQKPQEEVQ